ncbi:MAG: hypothetical protein LW807_06810 [Proteobacteria bacterium]|jgi:hypothetical protein|nr:hypothetical protein [Pseudomonadota bacterium]
MLFSVYKRVNFNSITGIVLLFFIAFGVMFLYAQKIYPIEFSWGNDSKESWKVATTFFSLHPYHSYVEYRGRFWFFILAILNKFSLIFNSSYKLGFNIFTSVEFAYITVVGVPWIFEQLFKNKLSYLVRTLFMLVIFYFFRGHFLYPLVDFPALFFSILGVQFVLKYNQTPKLFFIGLCGIFITCALLLRMNYLVALVFIFILFIWKLKSNKIRIMSGLHLVFFSLIVTVSLICSSIYQQKIQSLVKTSGIDVLKYQLFLGLKEQKIDPIVFPDNRGIMVLNKENFNEINLSLRQYLKLYISHPLYMIVINMQHIFNGLDISYPIVYVDGLRISFIFCLLNYILIFLYS